LDSGLSSLSGLNSGSGLDLDSDLNFDAEVSASRSVSVDFTATDGLGCRDRISEPTQATSSRK
jgi:hypothetical protein